MEKRVRGEDNAVEFSPMERNRQYVAELLAKKRAEEAERIEKARAAREAVKESGQSMSEAKRIELVNQIEDNLPIIEDFLEVAPASTGEINTAGDKDAQDMAFIAIVLVRRAAKALGDSTKLALVKELETKCKALKSQLVWKSNLPKLEPFSVANVVERKRKQVAEFLAKLPELEKFDESIIGSTMREIESGINVHVQNADIDNRSGKWVLFIKTINQDGTHGKLRTTRLEQVEPCEDLLD